MRLVLLGPPGAGKGTQAVRLAEHFHCPVIATGEVFRSHVAEGTPLGRLAQEYLDRGDLVPDEVVINMVMERLAGGSGGLSSEAGTQAPAHPSRAERSPPVNTWPGWENGGFVLDGFPRTVAQAEALDAKLDAAGAPLDAALFFEISEDELFRRLAGRSAALHRADDTEQTIRHRLEVFAIKTRPLVDYYERRGLLLRVDAIGEIDEITKRILEGLHQRST